MGHRDTDERNDAAPGGFLADAAAAPHEVHELPGDAGSPAVTVIIPTHDRRDLVLQALEALGRQRGPAFEVVVVDDASTDATTEAVLERAGALGLHGRVVRRAGRGGPAGARNCGLLYARAPIIAFTDSDCLPAEGWLAAGLAAFAPGVDIVQGRTEAPPDATIPFFNHFIETRRLDGHYSTSNLFYRREAIVAVGGFDPGCDYWEDTDLGYRVRRLGRSVRYEPSALVFHQVIPLSPLAWLGWPRHLNNWPAKAARYPEFRRHLLLGLWADPLVALLELALAGLALARVRRSFLALTVPYLVAFGVRRRPGGRWPVVKMLAYGAWDAVSIGALLTGSVRHRSPVL
jgi:glycosyltransferase involved in cell wall biosynthesis